MHTSLEAINVEKSYLLCECDHDAGVFIQIQWKHKVVDIFMKLEIRERQHRV